MTLTITAQIFNYLCIKSCNKRVIGLASATWIVSKTEKCTRMAAELVREGYKLVLTSWDMGQSSISELGSPSRTEGFTFLEQMTLIS